MGWSLSIVCPQPLKKKTLDTKNIYVSTKFLLAVKYLLNSVMVGFLQKEIGKRDPKRSQQVCSFITECHQGG